MPNPEMYENAASELSKERYAKEKPARKYPERKALRNQSVRQEVRTAFLAGVKYERVIQAIALKGGVTCAVCKQLWRSVDRAVDQLDLHHLEKRSHARGYIQGKGPGCDDPRLLMLVCRPCHRTLESNPKWSKQDV